MYFCEHCGRRVDRQTSSLYDPIQGKHFCNDECSIRYNKANRKTATEAVINAQPNKGEVIEKEIAILKRDILDLQTTINKMEDDNNDLYGNLQNLRKVISRHADHMRGQDNKIFKLEPKIPDATISFDTHEAPQNKLIDWLHKHPEIDTTKKFMAYFQAVGGDMYHRQIHLDKVKLFEEGLLNG